MNSFDYFFEVLLGERLFLHTDNLSATLQKKEMSAAAGQRLAIQTVETLKRIREECAFNAFYESVLEKKKSLPDFGEPILKRNRQAPVRYCFGKAPIKHPSTTRDHYREVYFEAVHLLVRHIED